MTSDVENKIEEIKQEKESAGDMVQKKKEK